MDYYCNKYRPEGVYNENPSMPLQNETVDQVPADFWKAVMHKYARVCIGYTVTEMHEQSDYHEHTRGEERDICDFCRNV